MPESKRAKKLVLTGADPARARKYYKRPTQPAPIDESSIIIERLEDDEERDRIHILTGQRKTEAMILMHDVMRNGPLMDSTDERCAWCRHQFDTAPIGLPIKYHPSCVRSYVYGVNRMQEVPISQYRMEDMKWMDPELEPQCRESVVDRPVTPKQLEKLILKKQQLNKEWREPLERLRHAIGVVRAHLIVSEDSICDSLDVFIEESEHFDDVEIESLDDVEEHLERFKTLYHNIPHMREKGRRLRLSEALNVFYHRKFLGDDKVAVATLRAEAHNAIKFGFHECNIESPMDVADQIDAFENLAMFYEMKVEPLTVVERDYFETDLIFCSFNCAKAFAHANGDDVRYKHSGPLLMQLFKRLYDVPVYRVGDRTKLDSNDPRHMTQAELDAYAESIRQKSQGLYVPIIVKAPSWRLIRGNGAGGNLSIDEFRESYCKCHYSPLNITKRPYMFPSGMMYEVTRVF